MNVTGLPDLLARLKELDAAKQRNRFSVKRRADFEYADAAVVALPKMVEMVERMKQSLDAAAAWNQAPHDDNGELSYAHFDEPCGAAEARDSLRDVDALAQGVELP